MKTQQYFTNCLTLEALKFERNRLAKLHHPDMGGDNATMQEINAQFESAKKRLEAPSVQRVYTYNWGSAQQHPGMSDDAVIQTMKEWMERLRRERERVQQESERLKKEVERQRRAYEIREMWYEVHKAEQQGLFRQCRTHYRAGEFLIISGHTYPYKEWLKEHGFRWMPESRNWHFHKKPQPQPRPAYTYFDLEDDDEEYDDDDE